MPRSGGRYRQQHYAVVWFCDSQRHMDGASHESALARIDAALARLEAIASRPAAASGTADGELAARHDRLRAAVSQSLRQLDGLIAGQNP